MQLYVQRIKILFAGLMYFSIACMSCTNSKNIARDNSIEKRTSLINPSFEDRARHSAYPITGWLTCARDIFPDQTPPDIIEHAEGLNKENPAIDGETYLRMVVRANKTYESVSQNLREPLSQGICYDFNLSLARPENFESFYNVKEGDSLRLHPATFDNPVILRIWGSTETCIKDELLGETPPVRDTTWRIHKFIFIPTKIVTCITLEAFYASSIEEPYDGALLLDNCSNILPVDCK